MTLEETGRRILNRRRALRLSQKALAHLCGCAYQVISRVERGHQDIYAQRMAAVAKALGVSADYLLCLSDQELPHA